MRLGKALCCATMRALSLRSRNIDGKYVAQFTGGSIAVNVVVVSVNSLPISRGAKALRPDLVRAVAGGAKEASSTFNERCGAANVASRGKI